MCLDNAAGLALTWAGLADAVAGAVRAPPAMTIIDGGIEDMVGVHVTLPPGPIPRVDANVVRRQRTVFRGMPGRRNIGRSHGESPLAKVRSLAMPER